MFLCLDGMFSFESFNLSSNLGLSSFIIPIIHPSATDPYLIQSHRHCFYLPQSRTLRAVPICIPTDSPAFSPSQPYSA